MSDADSSNSFYDGGFTERRPQSQPTVAHFALILMTMLAVIFGVIAYMLNKHMQEMSVELDIAKQELRESNRELSEVRGELANTITRLERAEEEAARLRADLKATEAAAQ